MGYETIIPKPKKFRHRQENPFKLYFQFNSNIWKMNFHSLYCIKLEDTFLIFSWRHKVN